MATLNTILANQEQINKRLLKQEKNGHERTGRPASQVQENTDLEQSAVEAIQGIAEQLREALNNDDTAALQALSQQLNASAAGLAAAIAANTPAQGGGGGEDPEPMSTRPEMMCRCFAPSFAHVRSAHCVIARGRRPGFTTAICNR